MANASLPEPMTMESQYTSAGVAERELIEPGELEEVLQISAAFEKTLRVFRLYPSNNKIFIDFTDDLVTRFRNFLADRHELPLDIAEHRFLYRQNVVYEEADPERSIPMRLYRDAIRRIVFYEGMEKAELLDFLDVVTRPIAPESIDDDLVTLLWEKDFSHLSYFVLDDPGGDETEPDLSRDVKQAPEDPESGGGLSSAAPSKRERYIAPRLSAQSLSTVMTITDHDLETVERMIAHENARDLRHDLTTLLFELLELDTALEAFARVISLLGQLVRGWLEAGELREATDVLRRFRDMIHTAPSGEHAGHVREALDRSVDPGILRSVARLLESPTVKGANEFTAFFRLVGPVAIPALVETLPRARNPQQVTAILADLAREEPERLLARLEDANPAVLRSVVSVLGSMEDPEIAPRLLPHLDHPAVAVRLEVVRSLARLGGDPGKAGLLRGLSDPDYQVRVHALRCIDEMHVVGILPDLMEMTASREFANRKLYEKQEHFRAIARLGGEDVLPFLEDTIDARGFLRYSRSEEVRACATAAIAEIPGALSRNLLELYSRSSSRAVREAAGIALRRVRTEAAERAAEEAGKRREP